MWRPLLMFRTRGMSGPLLTKHAKIAGLSKASGAYFGSGGGGSSAPEDGLISDPEFNTPDDGVPWLTTGWTIAGGVATCGGAAGATLGQD